MSKAKVLVVTSGKGGVGKTTSTAALGAALAQAGQNVVVVDFDVGLRNLDLVLGAERRVVYDLTDVVQDITKLPQSLIRDIHLIAELGLTSNQSAASRRDAPDSTASTTRSRNSKEHAFGIESPPESESMPPDSL